MNNLILIIISAVFVNNIVLTKALGICPFIGVSKRTNSALGMGLAVTIVMTLASIFTYIVQKFVLDAYGVPFLQTISFIVIVAALVQIIEMAVKRFSPSLQKAFGIYLPLITTNCAVLGITLLNIVEGYDFLETVFSGFFTGIGFALALMLMSGIREKLEVADVPKSLRGVPIALISASLLALAFFAFNGMLK